MTKPRSRRRRAQSAVLTGLAIMVGILVSAGNGYADPPEDKAAGTIEGTVSSKYLKKYPFVAYLVNVDGEHPAPKEPVAMDQAGKKFDPRILPIVKGATVRFHNSDSMAHNVFSPDGEKYDLGSWNQGESRTHVFNELGTFVQLCKLHPEMVGYVLVLQNPFFAHVDSDTGAFEIEGVPPGSYKVKVYSERLRGKWLKKTFAVTVKGGETAKVKVKVK